LSYVPIKMRVPFRELSPNIVLTATTRVMRTV